MTITIHDSSESPVANATVSGSWSNGSSGSASCTTDGNGLCSVIKNNVKGNSSSVTFTVDSVSHASNSYDGAQTGEEDIFETSEADDRLCKNYGEQCASSSECCEGNTCLPKGMEDMAEEITISEICVIKGCSLEDSSSCPDGYVCLESPMNVNYCVK